MNIIVYDLETSGLSPSKHQVLEFAGVVINTTSLEIVEEFGRRSASK